MVAISKFIKPLAAAGALATAIAAAPMASADGVGTGPAMSGPAGTHVVFKSDPPGPGGGGCDENGNCGSGGQNNGPNGGPGGQGCIPGVGCGDGGQFWGPGGEPGGSGCLPGVGCGGGHA
ncbi:PE-PGRS family protein [Mycobacterium kubicae]|nr:PE-PGRS family protein [Mycobacterium kubicae]OBK42435.1 PE-PGRS family protein [Mycobacterium kubicae]